MSFVVDTSPTETDDSTTIINSKTIYKTFENKKNGRSNSSVKSKLDSFSKLMGWDNDEKDGVSRKRKYFQFDEVDLKTGKSKDELNHETLVEKEMKESVLNDIEKGDNLSKFLMTDQQKKALNKVEKSKSKGPNWFNLPATEVTDELKNDLEILQMRSALNPKHFYKKNDLKVLPKYFQVGQMIDTPLDYYNNRNVRKNKKRTMVDELMADAEFQKFQKRKYKEVLDSQKKTGYFKANQKMKKLKKKRR